MPRPKPQRTRPMTDEERLRNCAKVQKRLLRSMITEMRKGDITAMDLLGVLAYTTGACIAQQDHRKVTPMEAMNHVTVNIQAGNQAAVEEVLGAKPGAHGPN